MGLKDLSADITYDPCWFSLDSTISVSKTSSRLARAFSRTVSIHTTASKYFKEKKMRNK
jgi:hypothetical protein